MRRFFLRAVALVVLPATWGCQPASQSAATTSPAGTPAAAPATPPSGPAATPSSAGRATLGDVLNRELAGFKADTGVFVKNLKTGEQAGVRDDRAFNSFSVIKLGIMLRAFDLAAHGRLNLDQRVTVSEPDLRDGSGILYTFDAGLRVTLRDLVTQMVVTSDNTATDMLLRRVGGLEVLNGWLRDKGFGQTRMIQSTGDFFRQPLVLADSRYRTLSDEQVFGYWMAPLEINAQRSRGRAQAGADLQKAVPFGPLLGRVATLWSTDPTYWLGSMTARETGRLLEAIEQGTLLSRAASDEIKRIMMEQRQGTLRIPHYLPWPDYFVAHKTGDGPPTVCNDVGIVYGPDGPIVVSFFSSAIGEAYPEHEDRIGRLTRAVVDYFHADAGSRR
jgi:beta-lactamase class A